MVKTMTRRIQKAKKELKVSDLPIDANGNYIIRSKADAVQAVELAGQLSLQIDKIKIEQLSQLEADYEHLRKSLKEFQDRRKIAEIKTPNFRSDLVERTGSMWIWSDDEIPKGADTKTVVPLLTILRKRFKSRQKRTAVISSITRRVIDPGKLDDAVKMGVLNKEDIDPAYVEFISTSYVQIKENK